jgi:hypothetical protein
MLRFAARVHGIYGITNLRGGLKPHVLCCEDLFNYTDRKFTPKTIASLGQQMIDAIEHHGASQPSLAGIVNLHIYIYIYIYTDFYVTYCNN